MWNKIFKSQELFAELKQSPGKGWWQPLILLTALSICFSVIVAHKMDWEAKLDSDMAMSGRSMPPERRSMALAVNERWGSTMKIASGVCSPFLQYLLAATIFWLIFNIRKVPVSYLSVLGFYAWTDLINLPRALLMLIAALRASTLTSEFGIKALDPGYPLFFSGIDPDDASPRRLMLWTLVNLFMIGHLFWFSRGIAYCTGISRGRAFKLTLIPVIIGILLRVSIGLIFLKG